VWTSPDAPMQTLWQQDRHHDGDLDRGRVVDDTKPAQELRTCPPHLSDCCTSLLRQTRRGRFQDRNQPVNGGLEPLYGIEP
jgi:hypothetical protein